MYELRGNIHIHTNRSDGTLDLESIIPRAVKAGLDFIGINDHHVECEPAEYRQGVLVLNGSEYNLAHSHYLAYDVARGPEEMQLGSRQTVDWVNRQRGMGIIAHPFEKGSPYFSGGRAYQWQDWDVDGYQGIELWNATSQWKEYTAKLFRAVLALFFDRYRPLLAGPCQQAMQKWDMATRHRHVTGVAGSDLHGLAVRLGCLRLAALDYPMLFRALNNYVLLKGPLTGQGDKDGRAVLEALAAGRCWFALDWLACSSGFRFWAHQGEKRLGMGQSLFIQGGEAELVVELPRPGNIRLLADGQEIASHRGRNLSAVVNKPASYRVEVWLPFRRGQAPWVFSNPIYLREKKVQ